jgi:hypothetical protein
LSQWSRNRAVCQGDLTFANTDARPILRCVQDGPGVVGGAAAALVAAGRGDGAANGI